MTQILRANSTDEVTITAHFLEWRRQNQTFTDLAGYNFQTRNLSKPGVSVRRASEVAGG